MKILIIDSFGMNGGAEKVMINTYLSLKKKHNVACLLPKENFIGKFIESKDVIEYASFVDAFRLIKKFNPEKIILNNKKTLKFLFLIKILSLDVKVYYHSHSYLRNLYEKIIYSFILSPLIFHTICVSNSLKLNHVGLLSKDKKHTTIYNGFNFDFVSDKKKQKPNQINVFFWAQLRKWKGHLFLLKVIKEYKFKNTIFHFVFSTQDEESAETLKTIKKLAKEYNIEDLIKYYPNQENHLEFINHNANISLSCSRISDPLPTIIIESLAMGVPILSTNVGGSKEILREYPELLADVSVNDFGSKLKLLIENIDKYSPETLTKVAFNQYSLSRYKRNFLDLIDS